MPYELVDLDVYRVDAVANPANRRKFLLLKEMEEEMPEEGAANALEALTDEEKESVKSVLAALYPLWEQNKIPDFVIAFLSESVGYPKPEGSKYPHPLAKPYPQPARPAEKTLEGLTEEDRGRIANFRDLLNALWKEKKIPDTIMDWFNEALGTAQEKPTPDAAREAPIAKALLSEVSELRKALAQERKMRELIELRVMVQKELAHIPMPEGELAELIQAIKEAAPSVATKVVGVFKEISKILQGAKFLETAGSSQEASPRKVLETKAHELLVAGKARTIEQARASVLKQDPALYNEIKKENYVWPTT